MHYKVLPLKLQIRVGTAEIKVAKYPFNVLVDRIDTTPAKIDMMYISVFMTPFRKKGTYINLYNALQSFTVEVVN